jgi:hypothetical protein
MKEKLQKKILRTTFAVILCVRGLRYHGAGFMAAAAPASRVFLKGRVLAFAAGQCYRDYEFWGKLWTLKSLL